MLRLVAAFSCGAVCASAVSHTCFYKPRGAQVLAAQLSLADAAARASAHTSASLARRDARIEHLERELIKRGAPLDCRYERDCFACEYCTDAPPGALIGYVPEWARAEDKTKKRAELDARTALSSETADAGVARAALEWAREKL
jgi:hypothetical protein